MRPFLVTIVLGCLILIAPANADGWKAGTARSKITPETPMWMAGYGSRNHPSEGVLNDLWAKALALEAPDGTMTVLITLDVCGIDRALSNDVRDTLKQRHGLDRKQIVIACSHTHSGPVLGHNLLTMYPLDATQLDLVKRYTETLREKVLSAADAALKGLAPAALSWGTGFCDFAVNRRNNVQLKAAELRAELKLAGPVDHTVPVLKVTGADGATRAIVCQYACHCTVLSGYQFTGDYAGFAQIDLERAHPGAQAMFVAGCGADQNPLPRGTVGHAERYGKQLADAVEHVLAGPMRPVGSSFTAAYTEIPLEFAAIPDRAHWETEAKSTNLPTANRAKMLLGRLDAEGALAKSHPYPVQLWRLGDELTWIFLGGEVTVEYGLRLKRNLGTSHTWVAGYCNDVMAYIPSLKVLKEGGYEGGGAMVYYGLPAPWSENVEEHIVDTVRGLVGGSPGH